MVGNCIGRRVPNLESCACHAASSHIRPGINTRASGFMALFSVIQKCFCAPIIHIAICRHGRCRTEVRPTRQAQLKLDYSRARSRTYVGRLGHPPAGITARAIRESSLRDRPAIASLSNPNNGSPSRSTPTPPYATPQSHHATSRRLRILNCGRVDAFAVRAS
jgi:hypothetical protein